MKAKLIKDLLEDNRSGKYYIYLSNVKNILDDYIYDSEKSEFLSSKIVSYFEHPINVECGIGILKSMFRDNDISEENSKEIIPRILSYFKK